MGMLEYDLAFRRTIKLHVYSWLVKAFYYLDWLMDDWSHSFVLFLLLRSVQVCTTEKTQIRTFLDIFFFYLFNQRKRMWRECDQMFSFSDCHCSRSREVKLSLWFASLPGSSANRGKWNGTSAESQSLERAGSCGIIVILKYDLNEVHFNQKRVIHNSFK